MWYLPFTPAGRRSRSAIESLWIGVAALACWLVVATATVSSIPGSDARPTVVSANDHTVIAYPLLGYGLLVDVMQLAAVTQ